MQYTVNRADDVVLARSCFALLEKLSTTDVQARVKSWTDGAQALDLIRLIIGASQPVYK
jgi:hypothetical protein